MPAVRLLHYIAYYMMLINAYWTDGKTLVKPTEHQGRVSRAVMMKRLPTWATWPCPPCLLLSFHLCQLLLTANWETSQNNKALRLTWIRLSPNWHLVFLTLHYNCEWEVSACTEVVVELQCYSMRLSLRVGGCEWVSVWERERDRKQTKEDTTRYKQMRRLQKE